MEGGAAHGSTTAAAGQSSGGEEWRGSNESVNTLKNPSATNSAQVNTCTYITFNFD